MHNYTKYLHKNRETIANKRFVKNFLFLITAILVLLFLVFPSNATNIPTQEKYFTIVVRKGDTLWSIAREYMPNTEVREAIHILREVNGLKSATIRRGETIIVPKEELTWHWIFK